MNLNYAFRRSARPVLCALTLVVMTLPGCQGRKVVARVNSETINEDDFYSRALRVTNVTPQAGLDAGGLTLVNMVRENLVQQLAKSKGVTVSDDQVNKYVAIMEKLNPQILEGVKAGKIMQEDVNREYHTEMLLFALGTDNAKPEQKEVQDAYDKHKQELTIPGSYKIRILPLQDPTKAPAAMAELKSSGDFKKAALLVGIPPDAAANIGKDTAIPATQAPPELRAVLDTLKPLSFTPQPVSLATQSGQFYIIAQLIDKTEDHVLTLDESRARVERLALMDKFPQWGTHADTALNDFITASKDNIQINIDRYKTLKEQFIVPKPKAAIPQRLLPAARRAEQPLPPVEPRLPRHLHTGSRR